MNYKTTGIIKSISDIKTLNNGAQTISYLLDSGEQYNNLYSFDLYKSADKLEHMENFVKYNKVGDSVTVEWNVRTNEYNGKHYVSLNHWSIEKVDKVNSQPVAETFVDEDSDLPF